MDANYELTGLIQNTQLKQAAYKRRLDNDKNDAPGHVEFKNDARVRLYEHIMQQMDDIISKSSSIKITEPSKLVTDIYSVYMWEYNTNQERDLIKTIKDGIQAEERARNAIEAARAASLAENVRMEYANRINTLDYESRRIPRGGGRTNKRHRTKQLRKKQKRRKTRRRLREPAVTRNPP